MPINPLSLLPDAVRNALYVSYFLAVVCVGALDVGGVDVGKAPEVLAYLGGALALTAKSNLHRKDSEPGS